MGIVAAEIVLDLRLCARRTVGRLLNEAAALDAGDGRLGKLEESMRRLEEERTKIEAFKRELPLCMLLLTYVIEGLKKELERWRGERFVRAFEEFVPSRSRCDKERAANREAGCEETMKWMNSAQLWSDGLSDEKNDNDKNISKQGNGRSDRRRDKGSLFSDSKSLGGAFVPFGKSVAIMNSSVEVKPRVVRPELSLTSTAVTNSSCPVSAGSDEHFSGGSGSTSVVCKAPVSVPASEGAQPSVQVQQQQQLTRKTRRCWSQELHRKFVRALQQLGGAQVATPKQIRDLMNFDGLTNDEVKSHLQKYRLHTRTMPNVSTTADRSIVDLRGSYVPSEVSTSPQQSLSHSGSPQSPLHLTGCNPITATTGDKCMEEDENSDI